MWLLGEAIRSWGRPQEVFLPTLKGRVGSSCWTKFLEETIPLELSGVASRMVEVFACAHLKGRIIEGVADILAFWLDQALEPFFPIKLLLHHQSALKPGRASW